LLLLLITAGICACALVPTSGGLSVERVLQRTLGAESLLDAAEAESEAPQEAAVEVGIEKPTQGAANVRKLASAAPTKLQWPLKQMKLSSGFGKRASGKHQGIDLQAAWGTPIYAAADGVVVYAGSQISGYGDTLIIRHRGDIATLYAHASTIIVKEGELVTRGQAVGYVGDTGNATGPHLHFEVRVHSAPTDPWSFVSIPRRLATKNIKN